jgi:hypothetical protein
MLVKGVVCAFVALDSRQYSIYARFVNDIFMLERDFSRTFSVLLRSLLPKNSVGLSLCSIIFHPTAILKRYFNLLILVISLLLMI